jgi:proteasome lid subunit RPN8/RPN11
MITAVVISKELFEYLMKECTHAEIEKVFLGIGTTEGGAVNVLEVVECKNISQNPRVEFIADPLCIYKAFKYAESKKLNIVALMHSHPAPPQPSALDIKGMKLWSVPWVIVDSRSGNAKAWLFKNGVVEIPIQII